MEHEELLRRAEDLARRCERSCTVTSTGFLSPAEQFALSGRRFGGDCTMIFHGGHPDCERKAAFFLPYYMEEDDFEPEEHICALYFTAGFGEPGHRDYMGAALGLGIKREWLGDIWVKGGSAVIFCLPTVESHLLLSLDKVGRFGVKGRRAEEEDIVAPERKMKESVFSVMSPRLDAVSAGIFNISRSSAASEIAAANVSLNYSVCLRPDATVKEGDTVSIRGRGKAVVTEIGGQSRKGRLFVKIGRYI